jgi:hypothetical protein
MILSCNNE